MRGFRLHLSLIRLRSSRGFGLPPKMCQPAADPKAPRRTRRKLLASVVETLISVIHRINHYPADKYQDKQLRHQLIEIYPVNSVIRILNN